MRHRTLLLTALSLATLFAVTELAQAYVIPPFFVCRLFSLNRKKMHIDDLTIDLDVTLVAQGHEDGDRSVAGRLYLKVPQKLRLVLTPEGEKSAVLIETAGKRRATPQNEDLAMLPKIDFLAQLFATLENDSEDMAKTMINQLTALGIATKETSYRRWKGDSIIYVIGAKPWDTNAPQAWFLKDAELPLYYRFKAQGMDDLPHLWEVHLRDWGSSAAGNWFPGEVEFVRDSQSVMRWRVEKADRNTSIPDTLFTSLGG